MRPWMRYVYLASVVLAALALLGTLLGAALVNVSESALVAVSWSLIPLLVFGVSGMVFGRNSLARPALLTVASLFLLCAFYLAIWLRL